jgi:hypothetical protein
MKIILATLVVTLSILLAYQDSKIVELEKQNSILEDELHKCGEGWADWDLE